VRRCEKIGRKRPGQAKPPAPPLTQNDFHWWRRRFRLRILIFSQLLTDLVFLGDFALGGGWGGASGNLRNEANFL
jgi:hypothetical protein